MFAEIVGLDDPFLSGTYFRPAADIFAIFRAPYFFLPIEAARAEGFRIPCFPRDAFRAANRPPCPNGAFALGFAILFLTPDAVSASIPEEFGSRYTVNCRIARPPKILSDSPDTGPPMMR